MSLDRSEGDCGTALPAMDALIVRSEKLRRAGKYDDAMDVLREALELSPDSLLARSAEALIALERGESDLACEVLKGVLARFTPPVEVDVAAERIELEVDESVAAAAVDDVEPEVRVSFPADSPYANPTMASLLEKQGYVDQASALRDEIAAKPEGLEEVSGQVEEAKQLVIAHLERWLNHLQRGAQL